MIILDKPYISEYLKGRIAAHRIPVLETPLSRAALGDSPNLVSEDDFIARVLEGRAPRLYANSENAIGWVAENLAFSPVPQHIEAFKNKEHFREMLRPMFPEYRFEGVDFADLGAVDSSRFAKPFIIKPAVGFFSLGVHKVDSDDQWPGVVAAIDPALYAAAGRLAEEHVVDGETITVDCQARTISSDFGRRITGNPLPGSMLGSFTLNGSSNLINCWVDTVGSPTITAYIRYTPYYDGIGGAEVA